MGVLLPEVNAYVSMRFRRGCVESGIAAYDDSFIADLKGSGRMSFVVLKREEIAWRMRQPDTTNRFCSFPEIARAFNSKTHSTFIAAVRRYEARIKK